MKNNNIWIETLPKSKTKNRSWHAALEAQFPSFLGELTKTKLVLVYVSFFLVLALAYKGITIGYKYYVDQKLMIIPQYIKKYEYDINNKNTDSVDVWNTDKKLEHIKKHLLEIAHAEKNNIYSVMSAFMLIDVAIDNINTRYLDRINNLGSKIKTDKNNMEKFVPPELKDLNLPDALLMSFTIIPRSAEDIAYNEIESLLTFLLKCKSVKNTQMFYDKCLITLSRIYIARGRLKEAEETALKAVHPIGKLQALEYLEQIANLKGDVDKSMGYAKKALDYIDSIMKIKIINSDGIEYFNSLRNLWSTKLEALEAQKNVEINDSDLVDENKESNYVE